MTMTKKSLWFRAIALGVLASVAYGIIHDQISVRISPAYLLDWHPTVVESRDPTVVALVWGIIATWWFGLILGSALAAAATLGSLPAAAWRNVVRAMAGIFLFAGAAAAVAFAVTRAIGLELPGSLFGSTYLRLEHTERLQFSQAAAMHEASYDAAGLATLIAAILIFLGRRTTAAVPLQNETPVG